MTMLEDRLFVLKRRVTRLGTGIVKFNPNHDERGRFSEGQGSLALEGGSVSGERGGIFRETPRKPKVEVSKEELTEHFDFRQSDHSEDELAELWNNKVGVSPKEFSENMLGGVKSNSETLRMDNVDQIHFETRFEYGDGESGTMTRILDFDENIAKHDYFKVTETGTGIGKEILHSQVEFYQQLGLDGVELSANIDVGSYAWARYGFLPSDMDTYTLMRHVKERADELLENGEIDQDMHEDITSLGLDITPKTVWAISDIKATLDNGDKVAYRLLSDYSWKGRLSFDDKDSMKRFYAYVGRGKGQKRGR